MNLWRAGCSEMGTSGLYVTRPPMLTMGSTGRVLPAKWVFVLPGRST